MPEPRIGKTERLREKRCKRGNGRRASAFHERTREFDIVVIAASTGGLKALADLLAALPGDFPAAVLVQMHLYPYRHQKSLPTFHTSTVLPVEWAIDGNKLRPGVVTVAPPWTHVRVCEQSRLKVTLSEKFRFIRPTADRVFESVAAGFGSRAIAVVLTGHLDDSARGCQRIKEMGGIVFAQDPSTAEAPGMPLAAITAECVDFVLPISGIAGALSSLVKASNPTVAVNAAVA